MSLLGRLGLVKSPPGSIAKVLPPPRSITDIASRSSGKAWTGEKKKYIKIDLTQGYIPSPVIKLGDNTTAQADWYRYGRLSSDEKKAKQGIVSVPARKLDDFDDGYASIRVLGFPTAKNKEQDLVPAYSKFIIDTVQESFAERTQVVETFGDFFVFFFGSRPASFQFSGTLINSKNANWVGDFMLYYDNFLRGTRCVENNARLVVTYGGRQVEGYMTGCATGTHAASEKGVGLTFSVLVTDRKQIGLSDDFAYFVTQQGKLTSDATWNTMVDAITGVVGSGLSEPEASEAVNATKDNMAGGLSQGMMLA